MIGCSSRIRVMLRDSVTRDPIVGAHVRAARPGILPLANAVDKGITNKDGVVILYIAEKAGFHLTIRPYYSIESREKSAMSWAISFAHPVIHGNTDWVQLRVEVFRNLDPEIEFKIDKY